MEYGLNQWSGAIKTFFGQSVRIISRFLDKNYEKPPLQDRVYTQQSILDDYSKTDVKKFLEVLSECNHFASKANWTRIFGSF